MRTLLLLVLFLEASATAHASNISFQMHLEVPVGGYYYYDYQAPYSYDGYGAPLYTPGFRYYYERPLIWNYAPVPVYPQGQLIIQRHWGGSFGNRHHHGGRRHHSHGWR